MFLRAREWLSAIQQSMSDSLTNPNCQESDVTVTNISQSLSHIMAEKQLALGIRHGMKKLRHCHPTVPDICKTDAVGKQVPLYSCTRLTTNFKIIMVAICNRADHYISAL